MSRAESRTFDFLLFMQEEVAREGYTWTPKYLQMTWLTWVRVQKEQVWEIKEEK